ncbi:MiaB/RimO family radical SAM methylthiotransferase [candidate division WOR-3 bacterium]|nr:MiaB/RimO family radical SAM methylthiotransferase [candidate division WOR-3 bacterium]
MDCFLKVYGCQMNAADSHLVSRLLADAGIREVSEPSEAQAVVLLTCSVRQHAEDRAWGFARTMRGLGKKVILAGCMGKLRGNELVREGAADFVLGPDEYRRIPDLLLGRDGSGQGNPESLETYGDLLPATTNSVSASVAVMRGCNNFCTYCVVPYARGPERSIAYPDLERQLRYLLDQGVKEIFLLGQNVLAYRHGDMKLIELLERAARLEGLDRLGFLTSHPRDLSCEMIRRMADIPQLLHFFHLPLQSASDRVLKQMRRGYGLAEYEEKIGWVRSAFPDVYLSTDLMVGFPGESEEDFELTLDAVRRIGFDFAYMFAYSERPGTKAADMAEKVPVAERKRRLAELIDRQNEVTRRRAEGLVGTEEEVFVAAPAPRGKGAMLAELKNYRPVILNHTARLGQRLQARLVGLRGRSIIAEPLAKEVA